MPETALTLPVTASWQLQATGPATLAQVMEEMEHTVASGEVDHFRPLPTGFDPLDDVLNGGIRRGDLIVVGGAFGVGKTILGLQVARNIVRQDESHTAVVISFEHDRAHVMSRLMCLESAEQGDRDEALTLKRLADLALQEDGGEGILSRLAHMPRYAKVLQTMRAYADRLIIIKASGDHSTLDDIRAWVEEIAAHQSGKLLVVVDYLQKIPVKRRDLEPETEVTTFLTQGLKEMAMALGIQVLAIAASDREGLKAKRMRLSDLRGSSALQYEADIGVVLNNKHAIVSREHMVYNPTQAEAMRNWVVMTIEKNRSGRKMVDMEYQLDAAHFRFLTQGGFVRERLIDDKITLA